MWIFQTNTWKLFKFSVDWISQFLINQLSLKIVDNQEAMFNIDVINSTDNEQRLKYQPNNQNSFNFKQK